MAPRLLPNVPDYGAVPPDRSGSELLRRLEGKPTVSSPAAPLFPSLYSGRKDMQTAGPEESQVMTDGLYGPEEEQAPAPQSQFQGPAPSPAMQAGSSFASSALGSLLGGSGSGAPATPVVYGGTPAATTAASTAAPATAGSALTAAAPYAAVPLAIWTAYNQLKGAGNFLKGDEMSLGQEAALALPTFGASFLVDPISDALGLRTGKDKDQQQRDAMRRQMQKEGLLDDNYNLTLGDGSTFNIGGDGSEQTYNVSNASDPVVEKVVGVAQVVAALATGKPRDKQATDLTGWLTNAAVSNAGGDYERAMQNLLSQFSKIAEQRGLTPEKTREILKGWLDQKLIDQQTYEAFAAAHESLVDGKPWQFDNETAKQPLQSNQPGKIIQRPAVGQQNSQGVFRELQQQQPQRPEQMPVKDAERFWRQMPRITQLTPPKTNGSSRPI